VIELHVVHEKAAELLQIASGARKPQHTRPKPTRADEPGRLSRNARLSLRA
jgi:hypothetical protein